MNEFLANYKYPIIGAVAGLILAILLFTIGFFKTILVLILMCLGGFLGFFLKSNGILEKYLK
ncbi:DUF2273 domain-containing protein [Enterococcus sp. CSURQ0835]|uniref:DUF2273 domain-containing protein n=1 Tax=Enterococcus sp. CSURQ0835 TaxID=2681394 RepID=UPI00135717C1|nr:DUF2273 domain-containing protein [Enterococcus sp. CSURQ0835]